MSWAANVCVNGPLAGAHTGDYAAFSVDITRYLHRGNNELIVVSMTP